MPTLTASQEPMKPFLTVWTATFRQTNKGWQSSSPACDRFWFDLQTDGAFSRAITDRFTLSRCIADAPINRQAAKHHGIEILPTFTAGGFKLEGYQGKEWLLKKLDSIYPAITPATGIGAHTPVPDASTLRSHTTAPVSAPAVAPDPQSLELLEFQVTRLLTGLEKLQAENDALRLQVDAMQISLDALQSRAAVPASDTSPPPIGGITPFAPSPSPPTKDIP